MNNKKINIMKKLNYQQFIKEALTYLTIKPTKDEMQFAYSALYCGLGLSVKKSIITTIHLPMFE